MSIETLQNIINAIPNYDGRILLTLNGESFLLKDLPFYCQILKKAWPKAKIILITTFNIDYGKEYIQKLFDNGLDSLQISCYAYDKEDYKIIHGVDLFDNLCSNISYLNKITIKNKEILLFIFENANSDNISIKKQIEFLNFAQKNKITDVYIKRLHSWQGRVKTKIDWDKGCPYPCSVVWGARADHLNISWEGNILPCCYFHGDEYSFGNINENSLLEIFSSDSYKKFYYDMWVNRGANIPLCNSCTLVHQQSGSEYEQIRLAAFQGQKLAGHECYCWGFGEAWRKYNTYFHDIKIRAYLQDEGYGQASLYGHKPTNPNEILSLKDHKLPIIIFASPNHNAIILDKIISCYPHYSLDDIVLAPAALSFSAPYITTTLQYIKYLKALRDV